MVSVGAGGPWEVGGGVGISVIVLGTWVMIPGLAGMWGAQIPAKKERAACTSYLLEVHAETQS